jgi:hypothetical protein
MQNPWTRFGFQEVHRGAQGGSPGGAATAMETPQKELSHIVLGAGCSSMCVHVCICVHRMLHMEPSTSSGFTLAGDVTLSSRGAQDFP